MSDMTSAAALACAKTLLQNIRTESSTELYDAAGGIEAIATLIFNSQSGSIDLSSVQVQGLCSGLRAISLWLHKDADEKTDWAKTVLGYIQEAEGAGHE